MADNVFINEAINESFRLYEKYKSNKDSLEYNSFMCCVARMLVLIYGKEIVNTYVEKNVEAFDKLVLKYDYDTNEYNNFKLCFMRFYTFDKKIQTKVIKKKNKYFNLVQKYLIDMLIKKNSNTEVDKETMDSFYNLLFTANSNSFYQKSYAVSTAYNPYEIDDYAKKQNIVG